MKSLILGLCVVAMGCRDSSPAIMQTKPTAKSGNFYYDRAYSHGKKSFQSGLKPESNPYISNGSDGAAWLDGWMAAKEEFDKANK